MQQHLVGATLNQMSSKEGIKKHGRKVKEALHEELIQLHNADVFLHIKKDRLAKEQRKSALRSMSFIKEKRDVV